MTDQPTGPEPGRKDQPTGGHPYTGSPIGGPPARTGLSTGCLLSLVILAAAVILFGVCVALLPPDFGGVSQ